MEQKEKHKLYKEYRSHLIQNGDLNFNLYILAYCLTCIAISSPLAIITLVSVAGNNFLSSWIIDRQIERLDKLYEEKQDIEGFEPKNTLITAMNYICNGLFILTITIYIIGLWK